ncbi:MAG: nuclear transport factor 2 family protein [Bacteroidales bacterium]
MKKSIYITLLAVLLTTACKPKNETANVDTAAAKESVNKILDDYLKAWKLKDTKAIAELFSDDGLYLGTDPSEFFDKKKMMEIFSQQFADTSVNYNYTVDKREIKIAKDGNSALVAEQFSITDFSSKIQIRLISQLIKVDNNWQYNFISFALIPKNEDLGKIFKAVE